MNSKESRLSWRLATLFVFLSGAALTYGVLNFHRALPEMAVNFQVSRQAAQDTARAFLLSRRFDLVGFRTSLAFEVDDQAKVFLERSAGVERTAALARDSLDLWYWAVRFFKPLEKLEYRVRVAPSGRVVGFSRELPEAQVGHYPDEVAARALAEAFLSGPAGIDLSTWRLTESGAVDRPARRDHTFIYEWADFRVGEAPYRMEVIVQGAEVGGYKRFLKVPDTWIRQYERRRSQNELFVAVDMVLMLLMVAAAVYWCIRNVRAKVVRWRISLLTGGVLTALLVLALLNSFPLLKAAYETTDSYASFWVRMVVAGLAGALVQGLLVVLVMGAGEPLYRADHPGKTALETAAKLRFLGSREFFNAVVVGYLFAAFHIGFVVFYYVQGGRLGFWSPAEVKYSEAVSTAAPWIYPLAVAAMASLSEEFLFRLFGIAFLRRLLKSTALAVLVQAAIWGFAHSSYPQEPGFARGIELTIIGSLAGWVMLRFGIWATLIWHFVFDAVLVGLFLFQSDNAYFWVSGLLVCGALAIPGIIAGLLYWRRRTFAPLEGTLNRDVSQPTSSAAVPVARSLEILAPPPEVATKPPVGRRLLWLGLLGLAVWLLPGPRRFGDRFYPTVSREEALRIAGDSLRARYSVNPDDYRVGWSLLTPEPATLSFLKRHMSVEAAEQTILNPGKVNDARWLLTFRREYDPEHYRVLVDQVSGEGFVVHHLPDTAAGARLDKDSALALAEAWFRLSEELPESYHLAEFRSDAKDRRTDWTFTWESTEPTIRDSVYGDAHIQRTVRVLGDEVNLQDRILKLPEKWLRKENERNLRWAICLVVLVVLVLGAAVRTVILVAKRSSGGAIHWRTGAIAAATVGVATFLDNLNSYFNHWWSVYEVGKPLANHLTIGWAVVVMLTLISAGAAWVLMAMVGGLAQGAYGLKPRQPSGSDARDRTDLGAVLSAWGVVAGSVWVVRNLVDWLSLPSHSFRFDLPGSLVASVPWAAELTHCINFAILAGAVAYLIFILLRFGVGRAWLRWALVAAAAVAWCGVVPDKRSASAPEFITAAGSLFAVLAASYWALDRFVQHRWWVVTAGVALYKLLEAAAGFLVWPYSDYSHQGLAMLPFAALLMLGVVWLSARPREMGHSIPPTESVPEHFEPGPK